MLETFYDLDELEAAIAGVRSVSSLPIVALMSFDTDAQTLGGVTARRPRHGSRALGVAAFGANHGRGPAAALDRPRGDEGDGAVLAALPNVGLATMTGSRVTFPLATAEYFSEFAATGALARRRDHRRLLRDDPGPDRRDPRGDRRGPRGDLVGPRARARRAGPAAAPEAPTELARLLAAGEFVISVQLDPPLGGNAAALIEAARKIKASGVAQIVDVNDNPRARARMSGLIASVAIQQRAGIETVPHLTPRDSTIAGLESLLLGAHAQGIRNVLAVTGDSPEAGDYPGTGAVYDVDAIGLVELLARFNEGRGRARPRDRRPTAFFSGVALNPTADDLELELDRFDQKLAAGARFAMTQVLFDLAPLDRCSSGWAGRRRFRSSSASGRSARTSSRSASTTRPPASSCRPTSRSATATPARMRRASASSSPGS